MVLLDLKNLQKQGDKLKQQFDKLEKTFNDFQLKAPSKKDESDFVQKCTKFNSEAKQLLDTGKSMKPDDPTITNFSGKLEDETIRLNKLINEVSYFVETLATGNMKEPETAPVSRSISRDKLRTMSEENMGKSSQSPTFKPQETKPQYHQPPEQSEDEEDESEEEPDARGDEPGQKLPYSVIDEEEIPAGGSASNTNYQPKKGDRFQVLGDLSAAQKGDLQIRKGEILQVSATREDGWWEAVNNRGEKGLIPSNYLKRMPRQVPRTTPADKGPHPYEDIDQELDDRDFETPPTAPAESTPEFGHQVWGGLRKQLHQLMKRHIRLLKCMRVVRCENVPTTEDLAGLEVQSRHIRMCLFDGSQVLSNIHTIRAQYSKRQPKIWRFIGDKLTDMQSCAEHGDFFVRSNYAKKEVVLLIEVGLSFLRTSTRERGELSCGWTSLSLLTETGVDTTQKEKYVHFGHETISNKSTMEQVRGFDRSQPPAKLANQSLSLAEEETKPRNDLKPFTGVTVYNLLLNGGTPFDKGISLTSGTDKSTNPLKSAISGSRQPHLVLKVMAATETQREYMDALPDVLIWSTVFAPFAYWFRRLAGEKLIKNREDMQSAELIPDAFLSTFPYVAQEPDLMDVVRILWADKQRITTRNDKKSENNMAEQFQDVFCMSGAVLYNTIVLPAYSLLNAADIEVRKQTFDSFVESFRKEKEPATWLSGSVNNSVKFAPVDIFDMALSLTGPHSLD